MSVCQEIRHRGGLVLVFWLHTDKIFSDAISDRLAAIGEDIRKKAALKDRDIPNEFQKGLAVVGSLFFK